MKRTAAIVIGALAALTFSAGPAAAETEPVITDPVTGEVVAYADCYNEPYEWADGWVCTSMDEAERQGLLTCEAETVEYEVGVWTCETPVVEPEPTEEPAPVEPNPASKPKAEPVPVVVDNGDWGWSDARESYSA